MNPRILLLIVLSCITVAAAQAQTVVTPGDSSGPPDLNGKWVLVRGRGGNMATVFFVQTGTQVEVNLNDHVRCLGNDVVMRMNLHGDISGSQLRMRVTDAQLEGGFQNPCNTAEFVGQIDFRGEISPERDEIKGHTDGTESVFSLWVFRRPAMKKKKGGKT